MYEHVGAWPFAKLRAAQALGEIDDGAVAAALVRSLPENGMWLTSIAPIIIGFGDRQVLTKLLARFDHLMANPYERGENGPDKLEKLRGQTLFALGRLEEAIAAFSWVIANRGSHSEEPELLDLRSLALLAKGVYHDTLVDIERSLDLAPTEAVTRYWRALAHIGLRDWAKAAEDLLLSNIYSASDGPLGQALEHFWGAVVCRGQKDISGYEVQREQCRKAIDAIADKCDYTRVEGLLVQLEGDMGGARTRLGRAMDLKPYLNRFRNTRIYLSVLVNAFPDDVSYSTLLGWLEDQLNERC